MVVSSSGVFGGGLVMVMVANWCVGESHSALILLYRAIDLPTAEEVKD